MGKYENEALQINRILVKGSLITHEDRLQLLRIYQVPYHDSGKIEKMYSCDSSCNHCNFCKNIRENGKNNPLLICNYCYDNEQEQRWKNVYNRHGLQLKIMSSVIFTREELSTLKIKNICRFNSSGDIENVTMAINYLNIAYSHPETKFGLFAKNTSPIIKATDLLGKPNNCRYIQSSPIIGKQIPLAKYFDILFVVYPDKTTTENAIKNGACECNGKKCIDCGFKCYLKNGWKDNSVVAETLRLKKKNQMDDILTAYYNR